MIIVLSHILIEISYYVYKLEFCIPKQHLREIELRLGWQANTVIVKIYDESWLPLPCSPFKLFAACFIHCPPLRLHLWVVLRWPSHCLLFLSDSVFFFFINAIHLRRVTAWCQYQLPFHNLQLFHLYLQSELGCTTILGRNKIIPLMLLSSRSDIISPLLYQDWLAPIESLTFVVLILFILAILLLISIIVNV